MHVSVHRWIPSTEKIKEPTAGRPSRHRVAPGSKHAKGNNSEKRWPLRGSHCGTSSGQISSCPSNFAATMRVAGGPWPREPPRRRPQSQTVFRKVTPTAADGASPWQRACGAAEARDAAPPQRPNFHKKHDENMSKPTDGYPPRTNLRSRLRGAQTGTQSFRCPDILLGNNSGKR